MVKNLLILVIKGNEILLKRKEEGLRGGLPCYIVQEGEEEESLKSNLFSRLPMEQGHILSIEKSYTLHNNEFTLYMVDLTNHEEEIKLEEQSELMWADNTIIRELAYFENNAIKIILEKCIRLGYSSLGISMLESEICKRVQDKRQLDKIKEQYEEELLDEEASSQIKFKAIGFSILLGAIFSIFFFNYLGISHLIFTVLFYLYFFMVNGLKNKKSFFGYFFMICTLLLSLSFGIYTNPLIRFFNFILVPLTMIMSFLFFNYRDLEISLTSFITALTSRIFGRSVDTSIKLPLFIINIIKKSNCKEKNSIYISIRNGIIISIPLVFILTILLSGADNVFGYYISNLGKVLGDFNLPKSTFRIISSIFIALYSFGLIWSFKYSFKDKIQFYSKKESLEPITVITVLIIINMLYFIFTKIQLTYLYGGGNKILPGGFTYSEYARRGFFELVFITLINLVIISILKIKVIKKNPTIILALSILYTAIIGFTFNMVVSAFYKMTLYIDAFGYTRLRVLVSAFIILLGIILILQCLYVWKDVQIFNFILVISLTMYLIINFSNIDNYIASKNIEANYKGRNIDTHYLAKLSLDAISAMEQGVKDSKLNKEDYDHWKESRAIEIKHWFEFSYYGKRGEKN